MNRHWATWMFWAGLVGLILLIKKEVEFPWLTFLHGDGTLEVKYVYMLIFMSFIAIGAFVIYYIIRKI